jgi:hypothetical protein
MTASARTRSELEQRLEVQHYLPRLRTLALGVALIAAGALWAWPLCRSDRASWTGGPMSNVGSQLMWTPEAGFFQNHSPRAG